MAAYPRISDIPTAIPPKVAQNSLPESPRGIPPLTANGLPSIADASEREKEGRCPSCGQQLFAVKSRAAVMQVFGMPKQKRVPLTIPGAVSRGQCLNCSKPEQSHINSTDTSSVVGSDDEKRGSNSNLMQQRAVYEGPFNEDGERHGKGEMTWSNGDRYVGEFYNGSRHGTGTIFFSDGSEYVGEWEANMMHGSGTRRFPNGDIYMGSYLSGKREGEGRFYFTNGDMYVGSWKNDCIHGNGRYYYSSGQRFEGEFVNGKRHGKGKLQRTDGELDVHVYESDRRVGVGVRWSADRQKAWLLENGKPKKKLTVPEAVSKVYEIENAANGVNVQGNSA